MSSSVRIPFVVFLPFLGIAMAGSLRSESTYLELGPMIGHVGSDEFKVWVKASGRGELGVLVSESEAFRTPTQVTGPELGEDSAF
ncbi:MAG: hypothetical protein AAF514_07990, partial [Verrucomicrobiota bacterium]